jgi:metal-responsive CopG/Arc/MetJ family transcriptional regulator
MAESQRTVALELNQQQLELVDNTIKRIGAASREDLVRQALREFVAGHGSRHDSKTG